MSKKVRWGVLGTARIARILFNGAVQQSKTGTLYGIASRDQEKAEQWKTDFAFEKTYVSYDDLIADPNIDAVYIPLPNNLHKEWCIKAANAGKHIFCEKPIAMNAEEVIEIKKAVEQNNVLFAENYSFRYHPQSFELKKIIESGKIGEVKNVVCSFHNHMKKRDTNIRLFPEMGGGVLMDLGSYMVSLSRYVFGAEPVSVIGHGVIDEKFGVDMTFNGIMDFSNGKTATFATSFDNPGWQYLRVLGTEGELVLTTPLHPRGEYDGIHIRKEMVGNSGATRTFSDEHITLPFLEPFSAVVDAFGDAVNGKGSLDISDSLNNMRVLDALKKSSDTGSRVILEG